MNYPKTYSAINIQQPFGQFFAVSMTAKDLLEVTFSDVLRYNEDGTLSGSQRVLDEKKRLVEIAAYINSKDLAFPNSIIIAANYSQEGFIIVDDEEISNRWTVTAKDNNLYEITIPAANKIAAVIDGQHRLKAFELASEERLENTHLLVAIYFDLPSPYQAYLFASINYNQKPVSKSLALEQFGYLTALSDSSTWSPELLSVHLARKLNLDKNSSFFNHIKVAPQNDQFLLEINPKSQSWLVSMATVVEGILRLISTNPKRDSSYLNITKDPPRNRSVLNDDSSVLRSFYKVNNDVFIYTTIVNFFNAADKALFQTAPPNSFIIKTVGLQALFGILNTILSNKLKIDKNISEGYFEDFLTQVSNIDFSNNFFTASGIGKSRIQNIILIRLGFKRIEDIRKAEDVSHYKAILGA